MQEEISSEAATEAETLNKSKFKRDKTVKAAVATGDDRVDEDSGGNRVVDSSTNGNNSDIVVFSHYNRHRKGGQILAYGLYLCRIGRTSGTRENK